MAANVKTITEEMLQEFENAGTRYEVIDGTLVEAEVTGENHGRIEFKIILFVGNHVVTYKLGMMYPGDVDFVLDGQPGDIRLKYQPDVAFVKSENVVSTPGYIYRAPDLAVEIISPSQSYMEIRDKVTNYLAYGTEQVWIVIPSKKQIEVHMLDQPVKVYNAGDTLPGGELLPEFSLEVTSIFE